MVIKVHLGLLALLFLLSFLAGMLLRYLQARSLRNRVLELEGEKMQDHAEILQLQKKLAEKQDRNNPPVSTPVVPIKDKDSSQPDAGKSKIASQ